MGLQSILTIDGPPPPNGVYYCYVNNTVGLATPCEINVEGELFVCLFVCILSQLCNDSKPSQVRFRFKSENPGEMSTCIIES